MIRLIKTALPCLILMLASCAVFPGREQIRIASYNIAMGLNSQGELYARLQTRDDPGLLKFAEAMQTVRPDIILINEFDFDPGSARLLVENYLSVSHREKAPLDYPHIYSAAVNTGVDSGLDLDGDGQSGGPNDAWGFGRYPGQYGMLVLSRFPVVEDQIRTFRHFLWKDMPGAARPVKADGESYYPDAIWSQLRLSSKSHWDIPLEIGEQALHLLASHPTPPVFDGPEDRNGRRNHDEIRLWADYISDEGAFYLYDDNGKRGGLSAGSHFIIAGDQNSDPQDGDSFQSSIRLLTAHGAVNGNCTPASRGAVEAAQTQGGNNNDQAGNPAHDTADFSDQVTGNLRIDYALPSATLKVIGCGVFWPASDENGHDLVGFTDHRMVWVDVEL